MNLLEILQKLIECIEGEYFVSDGALLGIIREGKLIEYDKDIDIYLLKNAFININKLTKNKLSIVNHYLCDKVFDAKNEKPIIHKWNEYLSYKKLYYPKLDRKRLIEKVRATYDEEKKDCIFTNPNIDIFYLNENLSFVIDDENQILLKINYSFSTTQFYDQDKFNKLNQDNQRTEYIGDSLVERNKKLEDKFKNSLTNRNGINNSGSLVIQDEINFTINDITI